MAGTEANAEDVTKVGPYIVEDVLGAGPHGTVYQVRHEEKSQRYVLKRLNAAIKGSRPSERFSRIARVVVALAHPGVADVVQMLLHGRHVVIVSELVAGVSLEQTLATHGPMHPREVVSLARQLCNGLQYAHQRCVYHTSLHPGNVFLLDHGSVKLTDLAIAALYGHSVGKRPPYQPRQKAFLAPEFLEQGLIHPPSDIYSLSMVLYSALTGELAFGIGSQQNNGRFSYLEVDSGAQKRQALEGPSLDRLPDRTPEVLRHALATGLSVEPSERPGSVNAYSSLLKGMPAAPIGARSAVTDNEDMVEEAPPSAGPSSRVCPACRRPVSPAGRVCLACGLILRDAPEMGEGINYFQDRARKLLAKRDLVSAEKAYRRAIQRDPQAAVLHNELGDVLAVGNRFDEAVKAYRQALKINPNDDDAWHDLGLSLAALHRRKDATEALQRAVDLTKRDEVRRSARIHLGAIAAESGRPEDAMALWQQVLTEDPGLAAVRMALASTYASARMFEAAEDQLRSVLAIEPENLQAINLMARVRERSQLEHSEPDRSYGIMDDLGGGNSYLGVGFDWGRWL